MEEPGLRVSADLCQASRAKDGERNVSEDLRG